MTLYCNQFASSLKTIKKFNKNSPIKIKGNQLNKFTDNDVKSSPAIMIFPDCEDPERIINICDEIAHIRKIAIFIVDEEETIDDFLLRIDECEGQNRIITVNFSNNFIIRNINEILTCYRNTLWDEEHDSPYMNCDIIENIRYVVFAELGQSMKHFHRFAKAFSVFNTGWNNNFVIDVIKDNIVNKSDVDLTVPFNYLIDMGYFEHIADVQFDVIGDEQIKVIIMLYLAHCDKASAEEIGFDKDDTVWNSKVYENIQLYNSRICVTLCFARFYLYHKRNNVIVEAPDNIHYWKYIRSAKKWNKLLEKASDYLNN